jgi:hypothetical protein
MDTMRPDERAAGVISGSDPYRELELYLEKVSVSTPRVLVVTGAPCMTLSTCGAWNCAYGCHVV